MNKEPTRGMNSFSQKEIPILYFSGDYVYERSIEHHNDYSHTKG